MKKIFTLFLFFLFANFTFAAISWMGNKAVDSQPNDSQTISFYVEMWDSYGGCHAEVGILEGGSWVTYPLSQGADNGPNSTWSAQINVKSNSTEYYFHGWDDWGAEVWDSNDGSNYAISINPTTKSGGNGNWNDSGNWCDGSVPSSTTASYIIAHNLVLNTNVTTGPLTINASASLSINATNQLTTGTITNNAGASGLVINSDATGNGSLIFTGTAPVATVERYMEGYSTDASGGWHLISSPVNNFAIESSSFEPGANDDFYAFDEGSYTWLNQKVGANSITNFTNGDGYLVARENNLTGDFSGTLNVADVSFNNLSVGTGQGWHLLGNPYPSALIFNETGASWNLVGIAGTAKVWDGSGNYIDVATDSYIPSTNGFFVQATNSTNSITIRKTSRTHNTTPNFKSTISNRIEMKISNDVNSYSDRCIIGFKESATEAFDLEFDSHKLYGNATAPSLSSKIGNEVFSTNYLTPLESSYDLKLEFKAGVNANYQLLFEGLSSLDSDIFVTLEDLKTGTFVNVNSTSVYDFAASTADTPDRFIVHLFKSPLGVDDLGKSNLKVYAHNNLVTVQNELNSEGSIQIYDLSGRIIFEQTLSNQQFNSYRIDAPNGVYILQVMAGANSINEKIIIANN